MTLSLNEVEATAKKATRGVGYPWGLAEEAGRATRWLCARDMDGCDALAELLARTDGADLQRWTPRCDAPVWTAEGGRLCPLITGAALSDRALELPDVRLAALVQPMLLLPFVALMARQRETVLQVELPGARATTDGRALSVSGRFPVDIDELAISPVDKLGRSQPDRRRFAPGSKALGLLNRFAYRTYAPATDASRLSGAGAGLSDND